MLQDDPISVTRFCCGEHYQAPHAEDCPTRYLDPARTDSRYSGCTRFADRLTLTLDDAFFTASCFCAHEPQVIYCTANAPFVPKGEERYLILDEFDPKRQELNPAWVPAYKVEHLR